MTDLEITRLCAEAMGDGEPIARAWPRDGGMPTCYVLIGHDETYDPLHDDAQAMALVKKFGLTVSKDPDGNYHAMGQICEWPCNSTDLNRAICECVAKMQSAPVDRKAKDA